MNCMDKGCLQRFYEKTADSLEINVICMTCKRKLSSCRFKTLREYEEAVAHVFMMEALRH